MNGFYLDMIHFEAMIVKEIIRTSEMISAWIDDIRKPFAAILARGNNVWWDYTRTHRNDIERILPTAENY